MAPRTDARVIEAIKELLKPSDGSQGMRRTKAIIQEVAAMGLGTPSDDVIQREAYKLDVTLETGPVAGTPGIGRPPGALDKKKRRPPKNRGLTRNQPGTVDDLAARAKASYAVTKSYRVTASKLGISAEYVRKLLKRINGDGKHE
jgi:hypothetical protein